MSDTTPDTPEVPAEGEGSTTHEFAGSGADGTTEPTGEPEQTDNGPREADGEQPESQDPNPVTEDAPEGEPEAAPEGE